MSAYIIPNPSQKLMVANFGITEVGITDELWNVHQGEDGWIPEFRATRQFFIDQQPDILGFQDWALFELYAFSELGDVLNEE